MLIVGNRAGDIAKASLRVKKSVKRGLRTSLLFEWEILIVELTW